jgi:acetylornithine deacetylase
MIVNLDLVETLCQLVAIPSVNPMGKMVSGPEYGEARLTDHLETLFQRLRVPYRRQLAEPGRENIVAWLDGEIPPDQGGKLLLYAAHQDTVPVDGMTIEPWKPIVRDGRVYGRGACDDKGGMTAMLAAFARLAAERPRGMPTLVMACTVNEECGFSGIDALRQSWTAGANSLIPRKPDAAIVAEPTGLDVVVAHRGVARWFCHTRGLAAHSSRPEAGDNAIYKMARVLQVLERYQWDVVGKLGSHPYCGPATMSVGTIRGGASVNVVPDLCSIEIDRRLRPDETPRQAYQHLVDYLAEAPEITFPVEHDPTYLEAPALSNDGNGPIAEHLLGLVREVTGQGNKIGVAYATDAAFLASVGVPTVVFGPGSIAQAHTVDEWLPINELEQAAEILYRLGRQESKTEPATTV